ncbi:bifunctional protein tyrosine phosphatase family protein/NAD(P)/FAD-dependent oxidoreductase [Paraburkholderia caballeronis]|uniref:Sulfide:quinone oxidoreductase n=1 Tax=Paraburkholderia caballeronis TaxID=416943 RepID=A0A1H7R1Q7_9BURK|nr:bifunctional protein tyrosine phosphatase family protein/NAD(P)/FAD-dependent oxidoreductase [Paraburkholderia caballeronis]PXW23702.1 sulfide:quinone oxidoreductase [Paraburkholderia caballeronis]PXW99043.1 sulfide:quinone oxidoreductase [Paraburkholderia caballeronis]RAJ96249.1 sulfide:quinone oxidoreductase [Paraburkholderia caballeronis]TDV34764.1 sulfide:quinone oxidoreductase [Paraburkholderia caballeronis]SEC84405.1 sulfide:quinone oxidoreductase [Paraburkholderia caballeronis]
MQLVQHDERFSSADQITPDDLPALAQAGYRSIVCNRPDHEGGAAQPTSDALRAAAAKLGLQFAYLPVKPGQITAADAEAFAQLLVDLPAPVLAFCRSGTRATSLYQLARSPATAASAPAPAVAPACTWDDTTYDVVVIGGGLAGITVTASLLRRQPNLNVAIVEPNGHHDYQPAWTLVGGGAYDVKKTRRPMASVIPPGAKWIRAAVSRIEPQANVVHLDNGQRIAYQSLIVAPGLRLAWERIAGLTETLGKNGVTSNYRYDLAPYTWELVQSMKGGTALFTQPPMPIKCAGAPQKAMYLACDHWRRSGVLSNVNVEFDLAGAVLFGVATFVPPLMEYVKRYGANLVFSSNLVAIDGPSRTATFEVKDANGNATRVAKHFDMIHVVPPQVAPDFIRDSQLADEAGWCEVDHATLQHPRYPNVFGLGDVASAPNAKTGAAARKQAVIVAENLLAARAGQPLAYRYDGYGSCPLTVERGKVVLAEFGYGGKLLPTFPLDPTRPRRLMWFLKASVLPRFYWSGMLKGREWFTRASRG